VTEDVIIHSRHLREAGMCARGAKQWFRLHGLDFNSFLAFGIPAATVEALGDALGNKVAAVAREEAEDEK